MLKADGKYITHKTDDYRTVVGASYASDARFCLNHHRLSPRPVEECVDDTVTRLVSERNVFYEIIYNGELVGWFSKHGDKNEVLAGFFILPKFRTREHVTRFWQLVRSRFKRGISCGIYNNNQPAMKFLKRKGFKRTVVFEEYAVYELN